MQFSNLFVILYCVGTFLSFLLHNFIERAQYVFRKKYGRDIPPELAPYITLADAEKTCAYKDACYRLWVFEYGTSTALGAVLLLSGFYPHVFRALKSVSDNPYALTLIFALTVSIPSAVLSLPFEWYEEFVIEKRLRGSGVRQALLSSGAERARPIVMTTIAMIAGMAPAVFASGSGAEFRATMSVAVICGLAASTLLSLVFVPTVYSIVDDVKNFLGRRLSKLTSVTEEDKQNAVR